MLKTGIGKTRIKNVSRLFQAADSLQYAKNRVVNSILKPTFLKIQQGNESPEAQRWGLGEDLTRETGYSRDYHDAKTFVIGDADFEMTGVNFLYNPHFIITTLFTLPDQHTHLL